MKIFVFAYVLFVIICGLSHTALIVFNSIKNKRILRIAYGKLPENDAEYLLRTALFKYPNAVISAKDCDIADMLMRDGFPITAHREI